MKNIVKKKNRKIRKTNILPLNAILPPAGKALPAINKGNSPLHGLLPETRNAAALAKEVSKLKAIVAKLTAGAPDGKPKQLYFDEVHLAGRWGMSVKHIRTLRYGGVGPKVTYFGRSVRYRLRDIVAFEKVNVFTSRSDMEVRTKFQK